MKKLITIGIISSLLSFQAFSNCLEDYEDQITQSYVKGALTTTGTVGAVYFGIISTSIGLSIVQGGEIAQGVLTTIVADAPAAGLSYSSIKQIVNIVSYSKVRNLIEESEVVFGDLLTEVAEELSEELGKKVTERNVSDLVVTANENKLFCDDTRSNMKVYRFPEVYNYLLKELK